MIHLKQQGSSYAEIAAMYGISRQRVHQIVKRDGKRITPHTRKNPLNQPSEAQGMGIKGFFVGLVERVKKSWKRLSR